MRESDVQSWCESVSQSSSKRDISQMHDISDAAKAKRARRAKLPSPTGSAPGVVSSEALEATRSTTPSRERLCNAELEQYGFRVSRFPDEIRPPSLRRLCDDLEGIQRGEKILPGSLRAEVSESGHDVPGHAYATGEEEDATLYQYPGLRKIEFILDRARICERGRHPPSSWSLDVYSSILGWVLRESPHSQGPLNYRYCTSATVIPEFNPLGILGSKVDSMVDFCLVIEADKDEERMIDNLCIDRPELSINHTDWGDLVKFPVAVSVETKDHGEFDAALLRMAIWHASQWRSLQWGRDTWRPSIEFLAGIIVIRHEWRFVATVLDEDDSTTTLQSVLLGSTDSVFGIYTLIAALQRLQRWAESTYWPAFKTDVMGVGL